MFSILISVSIFKTSNFKKRDKISNCVQRVPVLRIHTVYTYSTRENNTKSEKCEHYYHDDVKDDDR